MATDKIILLFENVWTGKEGITSIHKTQAITNATWFYDRYKEIFGERPNDEIEEVASELIQKILYADPAVISKIQEKQKENPSNTPLIEGVGEYLMANLKTHFNNIENRKDIPVEELFGKNNNGYINEDEAKFYSISLAVQNNPRYQAKSETEINELFKKELTAQGIHQANFRVYTLKLLERKLKYFKIK